MKKVLWCGGSHLANAKPLIEAAHSNGPLAGFLHEYYVTGGPRNRDWSGQGGRYIVDGCVVSGNAHEPDKSVDLSNFHALVFIGQYIQPFKAFSGGAMHSSAVIERTLRDLPIRGSYYDPDRGIRHQWFNEPLTLFPPLVSGPTFLLPDPAPVGARYGSVPEGIKQAYEFRIETFCDEHSLTFVALPKELFSETGTTKPEYALPKDALHMTEAYWEIVFENALFPLMADTLKGTP